MCLRAAGATLRHWSTKGIAVRACGRLPGARRFSKSLRTQVMCQLITFVCKRERADGCCNKVFSRVLQEAALHVPLASVLVKKACGVLCALDVMLSVSADVMCGSAGGDAVLALRQVLLRRMLVPQLRCQQLCSSLCAAAQMGASSALW